MADILHQITIDATPAVVFDALTTQEGLSSWWTSDVQAKPEVGSVAVFGFADHTHVFHMTIDVLEPESVVEWSCRSDSTPEWNGTRLSFKLTPTEDGVVLDFRHSGWASTDGAYALCNTDWGHLMYFLKDHAEGRGQGPFMS